MSPGLFTVCITGLTPCTWQCCWEDKCYINWVSTHRASNTRAVVMKVFLWQGACSFSLVIEQVLFQSWAWAQIFFLPPKPKTHELQMMQKWVWMLSLTAWSPIWRERGWTAEPGQQGVGRWGEVVVFQAWWDGLDKKMGEAFSWAPRSLWSTRSRSASSPQRRGGQCGRWQMSVLDESGEWAFIDVCPTL